MSRKKPNETVDPETGEVQTKLPGMEPRLVKDIHDAIVRVIRAEDATDRARREGKNAKLALMLAMQRHGCNVSSGYMDDEYAAWLEPGDPKPKIKRVAP